MNHYSVSFTTGAFLKIISADTLFDTCCAQQGAFMNRNGLKTVPVLPDQLRQYATECHSLLQAQIKACKTEADLEKLDRALTKQMQTTKRPGFIPRHISGN